MGKEKFRKVRFCFITSCFIKPFKMIINLFFFLNFSSSFAAQLWLFDIRDIKRGIWERQIAKNDKLNIYFKNNFNLLVMNVTQLNYFYWQNVHIWHFIKVNHKTSLLLVVVPTSVSWSKTKILQITTRKYKLKMWHFI